MLNVSPRMRIVLDDQSLGEVYFLPESGNWYAIAAGEDFSLFSGKNIASAKEAVSMLVAHALHKTQAYIIECEQTKRRMNTEIQETEIKLGILESLTPEYIEERILRAEIQEETNGH